jgi:hypothetical protein
MGIFGSKPIAPPAPISFAPDYARATIGADELQRQLAAATQRAQAAVTSTAQQVSASTTASLRGFYGPVIWIVGLLAVVALAIVMYDTFAPPSWPNLFFERSVPSSSTPPTSTPSPVTAPNTITAPTTTTTQQNPPLLKKLYYSLVGNSSGDLSPPFHDATTTSIIQATNAPLSAEREGGYGIQWWMYVKDWNYGYGKQKTIVKRPDATNPQIMNPNISLHPTDNSLQVSVSVYPATEGGSGKTQPAPAGHSGSSDDVFMCEVPNIPLQTWFSVSVTVFGRNMDIYLDGKLVKSCFLSGVPKPAIGDISLTPDGGFSGRICNFFHYPRMLTPSDALTFWSAGTTCKNQTATGTSSATGYSVKFGVYDTLGKEIQEYSF